MNRVKKFVCISGATLLMIGNLINPLVSYSEGLQKPTSSKEQIQTEIKSENEQTVTADSETIKTTTSSLETEASVQESQTSESSAETSETSFSSSEEVKKDVILADITTYLNKEIHLIPVKEPEKRMALARETQAILDNEQENEQQEFIIEPTTDGWFTIQNKDTQKYLTTKKEGQTMIASFALADTEEPEEQKWRFVDEGNGEYSIQAKSEEVLEMSDSNELRVVEKTEESTQKWRIEISERKALAEISVENGTYQFQSSGLGMYLSTGDLTTTLRKQLVISSENYSQSSKFVVKKGADGWYTITNQYSSLVIDVAGGSKQPKTAIQQYTSNQTDSQKFRFLDAGNGDIFIVSKLGTVIERTAGLQAENTPIQAYTSNNSAAQKWKLMTETVKSEKNIANGVYQLGSTGLNKNMALANSSTQNGIGLVIDQVTSNKEQKFSIQKGTDGWYSITNEYSNKILDIKSGNAGNKVDVQQYNSNQSDAQKFKFIDAGDGSVFILSKLGTVLERKDGLSGNKTPIQASRLNRTAPQKWMMALQTEPKTVAIADGEYQIKGTGSEKVFSIGDLTDVNSQPIQLKDSTYSKIDLFVFTKQSDGWYQIKNNYSNKVLDIRGGSTSNGTVVQQYNSNNSNAQKFRFLDAGDGYVYIESKLGGVLERPGASIEEGLVIKTYNSNKTAAQKWKIEKQSTPQLVKPSSGTRYLLEAGNNSNAVMDVAGGSTAAGAGIQIWTENNVEQQKFIPLDLGNGWYKLESSKSKKVLDITKGIPGAKVAVQQYNWNASDAQQFRFIDAGNGYVYIQSKLGSYLDIASGSSVNGTKIQTYRLNKSNAQKFKFQSTQTANQIRTTQLSKVQVRITIFNPNGGNADSVRFPTWSRENGQDDIKWLNGTKNSDGSWSVIVNASEFKHSGYFDTHIYVKSAGVEKYVGNTSYKLEKSTHLFVMGHGSFDPGAVGNGTNERDFTRNELLPVFRKYAAKLKQTEVVFYDPTRDMYQDSKALTGAYSVSNEIGSVTEIHLDSSGSASASGGHVIITPGAKTNQNINAAKVIKNHVGWNPFYANNQGLSERSDLLNLNVFKSRNIPYRLMELGFISNSSNVSVIRNNKEAICKQIIEQVTGETIN